MVKNVGPFIWDQSTKTSSALNIFVWGLETQKWKQFNAKLRCYLEFLVNSLINLLSDCRAKREVLILLAGFHFTSESFPPPRFLLNAGIKSPCTGILVVEYVKMIFFCCSINRFFPLFGTLITTGHLGKLLLSGCLQALYTPIIGFDGIWILDIETSEPWGYSNSQVLLCSE